MAQVNVHEAKTKLSKLMDAVESGREAEVILARNGRPSVRIVPLADAKPIQRKPFLFGLAKGKIQLPDDFDRDNDLIQAMFEGKFPT
jgi:prevent-host-death family protein